MGNVAHFFVKKLPVRADIELEMLRMKKFAILMAFGGMMLFAGNAMACPCHEHKNNNEPAQAEVAHCQHADGGS